MQRINRCAAQASLSTVVVAQSRFASGGSFDRRQRDGRRRKHTHDSLPLDDANRLGGRTAYFRMPGKINMKKCGERFVRDPTVVGYNVDVWAAQQSLRKRWKGRDWEVVEVPFSEAPKVLQRVIPELYTELPKAVVTPEGKRNVRDVVVDREDFQHVLYPRSSVPPYPAIRRESPVEKQSALSSFFSGL